MNENVKEISPEILEKSVAQLVRILGKPDRTYKDQILAEFLRKNREIHSLINTLSSNSWAILGIISFLLFIVGIYLYFFTRNVLLRKIGFFAGLLLLLVSIFSNSFASEQKDKITERNEAIVFAPTITIKSSPAESGTDLFVLHEGTKVKLLDKVGDWSEILLADGNRGWIPTNQIEII